MKFADDFDRDHVPEWRDKYLDYKTGKRLIKALQRAINRTGGVSLPLVLLNGSSTNPFILHGNFHQTRYDSDHEERIHARITAGGVQAQDNEFSMHGRLNAGIAPGTVTTLEAGENEDDAGREGMYALSGVPLQWQSTVPAFREAIMSSRMTQSLPQSRDFARRSLPPLAIPSNTGTNAATAESRALDTPKPGGLRRFRTGFQFERVPTAKIESHTHPIEMLHLREQELITFLQSELSKVNQFYQQKEKDVSFRLAALREQLHIMRGCKNKESRSIKHESCDQNDDMKKRKLSLISVLARERASPKAHPNIPFTPLTPGADVTEYENSDFVRKHIEYTQVSYRTAKHKLRVAMQEYYRDLEYLKSYSLLNRTAFRKLNKKYERTLHPDTRPTFRWFHENVDPSHFVNSSLVEEHIEAAEDLYTRYFERGNHKLAVSKLREITKPHGDKSESVLFNGLLVGIGLVFAVEGVWDGIEKLYSEDDDLREQTKFLLQIYAGYFLMLYLFTWFCVCCRVWTAYKINYPFIFEFDTRNDLDWRQLSNFPCIFWFLFGVSIWINFAKWWEFGTKYLFLWYPVVLVGVTLVMIFLPLPFLRWKSRKWFAIAHWRLLFSGCYPVEFRDFFLGDMYCSLTYAVANTELFFCLYITAWEQPRQCGGHSSRLMGALAALPPLWRALQCIRRFIDTKNMFPHLANLVKYVLTIGVAVILAMYRIDNDWVEREIYIALAVITSIYASLWDVFMDFSLLQDGARYTGLRDVLGFDMPWMYYSIILIDPILRFCWVPLVIFTHDAQRSTIVPFIVAFAEVTRRGMWVLFRVENEHCTNVGHLKASRDVPLPYKLIRKNGSINYDELPSVIGLESVPSQPQTVQTKTEAETSLMEAGQLGHARQRFRKAGIVGTLSRILPESHKQDFEKRKQPSEEEMEASVLHNTRRRKGIELALEEDEESDEEVQDALIDESMDGRSSTETLTMERESLMSDPETARQRNS